MATQPSPSSQPNNKPEEPQAAASDPIQEEWDAQGRMKVADDTFLSDEEMPTATGQPKEPGDVPAEPQPGVKPAPGSGQKPEDKPDEPKQPQKPDGEEEEEGEPKKPEPPVPEPKLLAGKYKDEAELRNAFIQLGGDPARYDTPAKLEEAYLVRQQEFSRSHAELAEQRRLQAQAQAKDEQPQVTLDAINESLAQVDWSQVKDARDVAKVVAQTVGQVLAAQQKQLDPNQIANQITPLVQQREQRLGELRTLEEKVPRLRKEPGQTNPFRDAFGRYVAGQKSERAFQSLEQSMKDFLQFNQEIVNDLSQTYKTNEAAKNAAAATAAPDKGGVASAQTRKAPEDDILEGIVTAHKDWHGKYNAVPAVTV